MYSVLQLQCVSFNVGTDVFHILQIITKFTITFDPTQVDLRHLYSTPLHIYGIWTPDYCVATSCNITTVRSYMGLTFTYGCNRTFSLFRSHISVKTNLVLAQLASQTHCAPRVPHLPLNPAHATLFLGNITF